MPSGWLLASTACLYGGGVVLNDYFDRQLDARERPERPIPSGRVPPGAAAGLGAALLAAGVIAATRATMVAAIVATSIAILVLVYDAWAKRGLLGPVAMGGCRGLNLLLGMAAVPAVLADQWPLALFSFFLILAVTVVSRGEVHGGGRRSTGFGLIVMAALVAALVWFSTMVRPNMSAVGVTAVFAWVVLRPFWAAWRRPDAGTIRTAVKDGVLSLMVLNAIIAVTYAGPDLAVAILGLAMVARALSRTFAVT
jgi:4-hydroxybenzoate polyprenyltransferase